jgi:hypothetical protein
MPRHQARANQKSDGQMSCANIPGGVICTNKPKRYKFDGYYFELSDIFGPSLLNKNGEIAKRQPGIRSNFMKAFKRFSKLSTWGKAVFEVIDER